MPQRSSEQIRDSVERNRKDLGTALDHLRLEVVKLADWRSQLRHYEPQVMVAAGVAGFVLGGGIAAVGALTFGRRARKRRRLAR